MLQFDYNEHLLSANERATIAISVKGIIERFSQQPEKLNLLALEAAFLVQAIFLRSNTALEQNWFWRLFKHWSGRAHRTNLENAADFTALIHLTQQSLLELQARQLLTQEVLLVLDHHIGRLLADLSDLSDLSSQDQVESFYRKLQDFIRMQQEFTRQLNSQGLQDWGSEQFTGQFVSHAQHYPVKTPLGLRLVSMANEFFHRSRAQWRQNDWDDLEVCLQNMGVDPKELVQPSFLFFDQDRDGLLARWLDGVIEVSDLVEWATPPSTLAYAFALQHRYRDRDRYIIDQVQEILGAHGIHSPRETLEWQAVVKHVQQHAGRSLDQPLPIHALLRDLIGNLYTLKAHASMVDHTLFSGLPSWLLRPVLPDVQLPEVQLIHGWPAAQIQALQQRTAEALGKLVVFRDVLKAGGEGPEMVMIPAGKFSMGSPINEPKGSRDEAPQHEVTFAKPFALGRYAVTFEEYDHYCQAVGKDQLGDAGWGRGRRPVINVTWHDAQAYCAWLSEQTGQRYRLPSEAEWEYACRAGSMTPFHWGNDITTQQANYNGSHAYIGEAGGLYRQMTLPVGQFQPNAFGLYDCHGNVWEWCEDHWHSCYLQAPVDGSAWVDGDGNCRVVRGGSWYFYPFKLRSAFRYYDFVAISRPYGGFRVARDL